MTKPTRFFAACLLVVSMSALAFGDGGTTQGPPLAPPAPSAECTKDSSGIPGAIPVQPAQYPTVDIETIVGIFAAGLATSIL
jgi:hypothetical protein